MRRDRQRGSAMLLTMVLITALLAGAAVLISLQAASNRSTDLTRAGISALYCAEAGLAATRTLIATNKALWNNSLGQPTEPAFLSGVNHDVDGDGSPEKDFEILLEDNPDESPTPNPNVDSDGKIFVISRCRKYPDTPRTIKELVGFTPQSNYYNAQQGGGAGNNNMVAPY